jgi:protein TonB
LRLELAPVNGRRERLKFGLMIAASLLFHVAFFLVLGQAARRTTPPRLGGSVHQVRLVDLPPGVKLSDLKIGKGGKPLGRPGSAPAKPGPDAAARPAAAPDKLKSAARERAPASGRELTVPRKKKGRKGRSRSKARSRKAPKPTPAPDVNFDDLFAGRSGLGETPASAAETGPAAGTGETGAGGPYVSGASLEVDAESFAFLYYLEAIREKVRANWLPPSGVLRHGETRQVTIYFRIDRSGSIQGATVEESSGITLLDHAAVRAVMAAAPFPALPSEFADDQLGVHFHFECRL